MAPLKINGRTLDSPGEKAEILNKQFSLELTKEDIMSSMSCLGNSSYPRAPDLNTSVEGVTNILKGLIPHKASDPDHIFSFVKVIMNAFNK